MKIFKMLEEKHSAKNATVGYHINISAQSLLATLRTSALCTFHKTNGQLPLTVLILITMCASTLKLR